jgi:hypothetical protein
LEFPPVGLMGRDQRGQKALALPRHLDVEALHHAVVDQPAQRLGDVVVRPLQRLVGLLGPADEPQARADRPLRVIGPPSARVYAWRLPMT